MRPLSVLVFCGLVLAGAARAAEADADALVREGLAAEAKLESGRALQLFLAAEKARPNDPFILQKIARQYSDQIVDIPGIEEKKVSAQHALDYSQRAVSLAPRDPVNVLSLAVCHGELALFSDTRTKVEYSRLVREEAERALSLDPNYSWAHHVLGRWHYEVADLGAGSRFFVKVFYGGLPGGSVKEAVHHLSRAVELEPGELEHHLELGFALLADNQTAGARACFQRGLAMPSRAKHDEAAKARARAALAALP